MLSTRRISLRQNYAPVLDIPVRITQAQGGGLAITATVKVAPQGKAERLANLSEATITIWRQDFLHWSIISGPWDTNAEGQVGFGPFDYSNDVYRLTAKHKASGAEVDKIFTLSGNIVVSEEPQHLMNAGIEMPATFQQEPW